MKKCSYRLLIALALVVMNLIPCFAAQNVISSVIISKSKDKQGLYELSIDSTSAVQYKTVFEEDGSVYFDLKNSVLAQNAGTIYDDVSNIDNVVVRQLDKNKVRIYVKGKNVKNTELVFINTLFETKKTSKKVVINRPAKEYRPVNNYNTDLENQDDIQEWNDNSFNFAHLVQAFLTNLKEGPGGVVLIILSLFAFCAIVIKTLTTKLSQENEPLIGLNQNFSSFNEGIEERTVKRTTKRSEAMKNAQAELLKAHQKYQTYLNNKYKAKPKAYTDDAIKKGIALNQYQKSTQNPYLDQEVIKIKKDYNTLTNDNFKIPRRPQAIQPKATPGAYIQRPNNKINYTQKQNLKPSNMKFLESVTKIYEQSGRKDLANELKNSVSKAKQSI